MPSYQVVQHRLYKHIERLSRDGKFEGNQAARTVLVHFAMNTSVVDNYDEGLAKGYVMEGVISTAAIMRSTCLSSATVNRAIRWLQEQGLIEVQYLKQGDRQQFGSIRMIHETHLSLVKAESS